LLIYKWRIIALLYWELMQIFRRETFLERIDFASVRCLIEAIVWMSIDSMTYVLQRLLASLRTKKQTVVSIMELSLGRVGGRPSQRPLLFAVQTRSPRYSPSFTIIKN